MLDLGGPEAIAVISDIHANLTALKAVKERLQELWIDELVVLGDLLTYGVDVHETLDLIDELTVQWPSTFIRGNHDQIYFDLENGSSSYLESRPELVQATARWTNERLELPLLPRYDWQWESSRGDVFFSHANPFGPEDWSYLSSDEELRRAGARLVSMAARVGVFGHTHKGAIRRVDADGVEDLGKSTSAEAGTLVVNPGSVGQPRGGSRSASFAVVSAGGGENVRLEEVDYDVDAHVARLHKSDLDPATKQKLAGYFKR